MIASSLTNSTSALQRDADRALSALASLTLWVTAVGAFVLFVPAMVSAQGTSAIAGVVRDSSGAVLPGVTIEAASPALIEKVRTVVSDEKGEYKIVNLPGGTYTVTFSLAGFSTIKREGLELTANFTVNVVAEMHVGQLEETVVVSGQSPIVDVQTTAQHKVVSGDLLYSLPLTKEMGGFGRQHRSHERLHGHSRRALHRQSRAPRRNAVQRRRQRTWVLFQPGRRVRGQRSVGRSDR
ncbi:MAG: hypothetical protein DMG01_28295 [Acidobacteria bacterium]|nr:MAG: hypothetical protein DMG01_28295 [Acidobacteriota bacterium]